MKTVGDVLREDADKLGLPLRTLAQVKATLASDKKKSGIVDVRMARLMLQYGRLTVEAREYVAREYSQA